MIHNENKYPDLTFNSGGRTARVTCRGGRFVLRNTCAGCADTAEMSRTNARQQVDNILETEMDGWMDR